MTQSAAATSGQRLGSDLHWNLPQRILCFAAQCAVHTTFQNRHCKNFVSQPFVWGRWEHCRQCPSYFCFWFYQLCPTVPRQMQTTEQEDHTRLLSSDSLHCTGVLLLFVAEPIFFLRFAIRIIFEFFLHLIRMTELIILLGQIWWVEQSDQWEIQFVFNKNHSQSPVDTSFNFFFVKLDLNPIYWQTLIDLHWHQKKYLTGVVCKHTALFIYGTTAPDDVICMSQPTSQSLSTWQPYYEYWQQSRSSSSWLWSWTISMQNCCCGLEYRWQLACRPLRCIIDNQSNHHYHHRHRHHHYFHISIKIIGTDHHHRRRHHHQTKVSNISFGDTSSIWWWSMITISCMCW